MVAKIAPRQFATRNFVLGETLGGSDVESIFVFRIVESPRWFEGFVSILGIATSRIVRGVVTRLPHREVLLL
jgi:hypothetical protein